MILSTLAILAGTAWADSSTVLSLDSYLQQVKVGSAQGRALVEKVKSLELRLDEAAAVTTPELYGDAGLGDDHRENLISFQGTRTESHQWTLGLRKTFTTGTQANLYYNSRWANLTGAAGVATPNYYENRAVLEIAQPIWRNSFGSETRSQIALKKANSRKEYLSAKYQLKNLLLSAENTYWSLVSFNAMVKLQEENVERSKKLRDLMRNKAKLRLVDDVDALQAQAAFETRELELQSSIDERAELIRQFNTLRGLNSQDIESLGELPEKDWAAGSSKSLKISREDFEVLRQEAEMAHADASAGVSHVQPQLDLVGSFASNSIDPESSRAFDEVTRNEHETWMVGVKFSMAIDIGLIHEIANSFRAQRRAAKALKENAEYSLERTYKALTAQRTEAQRRYEKSASLEKVQTELVKRERQRLLNGRTTTFQTITFEQNLASSQIQKVKAQLALLQIHNVLKTFEERPEERP